jgi:hypothetical protein
VNLDDFDKKIGVWRAVARLGDYKLKEAVWPEAVLAVVIGGGGAALAVRGTDLKDRLDVMGDVLPLAGAFLAVVFAALAIVVSLPATSYLRMLQQTPEGGMRRFLDPFLVAVGVQVLLLLLVLGYRLFADSVSWLIEHGAFYFIGFLFVFGLLDIVNLARQLVRHGILRAVDASIEDDEDQTGGRVRRLPERR